MLEIIKENYYSIIVLFIFISLLVFVIKFAWHRKYIREKYRNYDVWLDFSGAINVTNQSEIYCHFKNDKRGLLIIVNGGLFTVYLSKAMLLSQAVFSKKNNKITYAYGKFAKAAAIDVDLNQIYLGGVVYECSLNGIKKDNQTIISFQPDENYPTQLIGTWQGQLPNNYRELIACYSFYWSSINIKE